MEINRSSGDLFVYIISGNTIQNKLLQKYINTKTLVKCALYPKLENVLQKSHQVHVPCILLYDCMENDPLELMTSFEINSKHIKNFYLVLLNVARCSALEQLAYFEMVRGIFYSDDELEHLVKGIAAIFNGEPWFTGKVLDNYPTKYKTIPSNSVNGAVISRREQQIIKQIQNGAANREIAEVLNISIHTVKTHIYHIFKKLNVSNRHQIAILANRGIQYCLKNLQGSDLDKRL